MTTKNSIVLALTLAVIATTARADQVTSTAAFSGLIGQATGLQYFDPTLGTLDSVNVQITGTLQGQVEGGGPCNPACEPAPYVVMVNQDFSSFLPGQFFSFSTPAQFVFNGAGSVADFIPITTAFSYSFDFTNLTDFVGSASVGSTGPQAAPGFVSGTRAGFLTPAIPVPDIIDVTTTVASSPGAANVLGLESDGAILITYNYTAAASSSAVPEPTVWAGIGSILLLALGGVRRLNRGSLAAR